MSNLDQLIDTIAHPKTGKAMRYDPSELIHTGHAVWLAQRAREELAELRERLAMNEEDMSNLAEGIRISNRRIEELEKRLAEAWAWAEKVKEALEVYIETGFDDALYTAIEQCPEQDGGSHV